MRSISSDSSVFFGFRTYGRMVPMSTPSDGSKRWTLATVFSVVFLDQLGVGLIIPILAPLVFGGSGTLFTGTYDLAERARIVGFLIAAYPLAQFFGAPLLGALSDRH